MFLIFNVHSLLRSGESLQVRNAFLECCCLLVRCDGGLHVANDPVHHVLLLHPPQHIRCLHLVVKPLLDSSMGGGEPAAVLSLQLQPDGLLLGGDDVLPGGCLLLHTLLSLDRGKAGVDLILPDRPQGCLLLVKLLVHFCSVGRALCLDKVGENDGEADTDVEVVLHHKVFLGGQEGGDTKERHVRSSHASLGVKGIEPFSWEDECLHGSPLNWPLSGREVDKISLGKRWCSGQFSGPHEATGHHGRSDGEPGEHDDGGDEVDVDACLALGGALAALPCLMEDVTSEYPH